MKVFGGLVLAVALAWFLVGLKRESVLTIPEPVTPKPDQVRRTATSFTIGRVELLHLAAIDERNTDARLTRFRDGVSYWHPSVKLGGDLHQENKTAHRDLEIIDEVLSNYRLVYQENPVGTDNEEFAAALTGENPKKVVFIDPGLLSDGELLDRYGNPYIFHPLKADVMDLRSLGPDGQLWTGDDVSLDVEKTKSELGLAREK
ncbi:MAG TPA: hypothetical protein DDW68_00035 [Verrucomicrobiales bacterium]|nr:hypothetical protein [Verrucomicrobiales bacterium]HBE95543.1 hypothetical protein [Verrucomicrobiales bacterium]|tara:strand:- start:212 stop:820 length:609 start_codon:yes stop_codon:yes gene_type:complete